MLLYHDLYIHALQHQQELWRQATEDRLVAESSSPEEVAPAQLRFTRRRPLLVFAALRGAVKPQSCK